MGDSAQEVARMDALRDSGLFVRVIRERPVEIELEIYDDDPMANTIERFPATAGLYKRSDVDALKSREGIAAARFAGKGGRTIVRLESADGATVAEGVAACRRDEAFSKRTGLRIALGRAEKDLALHDGQLEDVRAISDAEASVETAGDRFPLKESPATA
jgi:hypothetical protein